MSGGVARLWVRAALRRWPRALLVTATLVVLSVATVSALVAGDALDAMFTDDFAAEWGQVDVEGRAAGNAVFDDSAGRLLGVEAGDHATAFAPRLLLAGVARVGERREPDALVFGLGAEEQKFPGLTAVSGAADPLGLGDDAALLNSRLARRLGVGVGDVIELTVAVPEWQEERPGRASPRKHTAFAAHLRLTVSGVVADTGVADLHRTPNVLLRRDALQRATALQPAQSTVVHFAAARPGRDAAEDLIDAIQPVARRLGMTLAPVKADSLDIAEEEGGLFRSILITLAALVVGASIAATANLLSALGQERARDLALLRAVGVRASAARRLLVVEALVYGVVAAVVGALLALPAARVIASALADHLASLNAGRGREQVRLELALQPATLVVGVLIVLVTVALTARAAARRVVQVDVDAALRGDAQRLGPSPATDTRPVVTMALGAALAGAASAASTARGALLYLGLSLLLVSGWLFRRRRTARRQRLDRRAAVLGLVWSLGGAALLGDFEEGVQAGFGVLSVASVVAICCATVLVLPHLRRVMEAVRGYVPRGLPQASLRVAGAQAERAASRTGVTIATVGIALFMVAALAVLGNAARLPLARQSGGFDVLATAVAGVDVDELARLPGVQTVTAVPHAVLPEDGFWVEDADGGRSSVPYPVRLASADGDFAAAQKFLLADALPGYDTAASALSAVLADEDKAVVDRFSRPEGSALGDDVVLSVGGAPRRFTLIAVLDTYLLNSVFVGRTPFAELVPSRGETLVFARGSEDSTPGELVATLERAGRDEGVVAETVTDEAADVVRVNRTFTDVFALMLLLALVVAVVSMAADVVRGARQRRAELAVLRAIGLHRRSVVLMLAAEPLLATGLGIVIGLAVGLGVLRLLFAVGFTDLAFVVDWPRVALGAGGTALLVALTCVAAATPASRRDPAAGLTDLG